MKTTSLLGGALLAVMGTLLGANTAAAASDKSGFALQLGAGTTGASVAGTFRLTDNLNIRGIYTDYDDDQSETEAGINYNFTIELQTFSLLLDWHPSKSSGFRVSVGAVDNGINLQGRSTATTGNITVGNSTFTAADVGTLNATVDFDSFAPYVGIGWGNAVKHDTNFTFSFDLGVIAMDSPNVSFSSTGTNPAIQAQLDAQLTTEANELSDSLDDFDVYPVVNFSFGYQF